MEFPGKYLIIASLTASTLLAGCGGGGGGGGPEAARNTQPPALTTLPAFLQGATDKCTAVENGQTTPLVDYRGTLANITEIHCTGATLANLSEVEMLSGLQVLAVPAAGLTGVDELQGNTTLTHLDLSGNTLTDLNALASLVQLTELELGNTGVSDISLLQALTALQKLDLSRNTIANVTALGNLMALTELNLANNNIRAISSLGSLSALQTLDLSGNRDLACVDIHTLDSALAAATEIVEPSHCATSVLLTRSSPAQQTIDNSTQSEPFTRLVITDVGSVADVAIFQSGNDLRVEASTPGGLKRLTFTGWFVNSTHQIRDFEIGDEGVLTYTTLRTAIGLGQTLTSGNDRFEGSSDSDAIYGLGGNDIISGNYGRDIITGGPGNDYLSGNQLSVATDGTISRLDNSDGRKDTFVYNLGDGHDTLYENETYLSYLGLLRFGTGITADNVTLYRAGPDLILALNAGDSITIKGWFSSTYYRIGEIQFGTNAPLNATTWVNNRPIELKAPGVLSGTSEDDMLLGTTGNDVIYGASGVDVIEGGKGNDHLSGNQLSVATDGSISRLDNSDGRKDTFIYNLGDGHDTLYENETYLSYLGLLRFGTGITADSITLSRNGNHLVLTLNANDSITIDGWFASNYFRISEIQFGNQPPVNATEFVNARLPQ